MKTILDSAILTACCAHATETNHLSFFFNRSIPVSSPSSPFGPLPFTMSCRCDRHREASPQVPGYRLRTDPEVEYDRENEANIMYGADGVTRKFKVVLLGESAVGKSSILLRLVKGEFTGTTESTIGAAFLTHDVRFRHSGVFRLTSTSTYCMHQLHLDGGAKVHLDIWDTAGQERYRALAPMYYRNASVAIIVYDLTSYGTYERAKKWILEVKRQVSSRIVIGLVGNKLDLAREVRKDEAQRYADENDLHYAETSAKTGQNVLELFLALANKLPVSRSGGMGGY